jgi:hypothetical protein
VRVLRQTAVGKLLQAREETSSDTDEQAKLQAQITHVRSDSTQHATRNVQHATCNTQRATRNMQQGAAAEVESVNPTDHIAAPQSKSVPTAGLRIVQQYER